MAGEAAAPTVLAAGTRGEPIVLPLAAVEGDESVPLNDPNRGDAAGYAYACS